MTSAPARTAALLAVSHGTSSPRGREAVAGLVAAVAAARPELEVREGFVDVQQPDVAAALGGLEPGRPAVVVPLLLSAGFHVHVDIAREVEDADRPARRAHALGPDARLIEVLALRLASVGLRHDDAVVLIAAGSSDPRALADCRSAAVMLATRLGRPIEVGFVSAATPSAREAVAATRARHPGARVVAATYLLAPGFFADLAADSGADITSAPLLEAGAVCPPELVDIVLARYDEATPGL